MSKILIVNPGSASKKYSFYREEKEILKAHFEKENGGYIVTWSYNSEEKKEQIEALVFNASAVHLLNKLNELKFINKETDINLVAFRTVAPGKYFLETRLIDEEFLRQLSFAKERAPLHVSALLLELKEFISVLPNTKKYSISDSTFYKNRFEPSKYYGLPYALASELEIFRFGYHGISASSIVRKSQTMFDGLPERMIICHLGSGISIIGVKDGVAVDTSMGFTPLEGTMMSTRVGNIDSGAIIHLMKSMGFSADDLNLFLNNKCGLLGVSEASEDMRILVQKDSDGDVGAKRAIDALVYQIKKQIGSLFAVLGGLDAIVFTATMGERSNIVRARVCEGLGALGIEIDRVKNDEMISREGFINSDSSKVAIAVIKTDEMGEMFEEVKMY